jgi:hypothetical protein
MVLSALPPWRPGRGKTEDPTRGLLICLEGQGSAQPELQQPVCGPPLANPACPILPGPFAVLHRGFDAQVCEGEGAAASVRSWLAHYEGGLHLEVRTVTEGASTVEALRQVADRIRTDTFVLLSGDVVTEVRWAGQGRAGAGWVWGVQLWGNKGAHLGGAYKCMAEG